MVNKVNKVNKVNGEEGEEGEEGGSCPISIHYSPVISENYQYNDDFQPDVIL
jgi:hypothetical protein